MPSPGVEGALLVEKRLDDAMNVEVVVDVNVVVVSVRLRESVPQRRCSYSKRTRGGRT